MARFHSKYASHRVKIGRGRYAEFKRNVLKTDDADLAAAIRASPEFGKSIFEVDEARVDAAIAEADAKKPTQSTAASETTESPAGDDAAKADKPEKPAKTGKPKPAKK